MIKLKKVISALTLIMPLIATAPAALADGIGSLKNFYTNTNAMRADFYQVVTDKQGRKIQEVQGEMQLKRPNMFRWDYKKPFEQQIIGDGKAVWLYDIELAQVTVRPLSKALGSSPAALLSNNDNLEKNFKLVNLPSKDHLDWVSAKPVDADSEFEKIALGFKALGFKESVLQEMNLEDSFGHQTHIVFSNQVQNPVIDTKTFLFKAPKGVDVVGE